MSEEGEAKIRRIALEWDDGNVERVFIPRGVSSITIDLTARKERGRQG